jgi:hypothetical protein
MIGGMIKNIRDLESDKVWQIEFGVLCGYEGGECSLI